MKNEPELPPIRVTAEDIERAENQPQHPTPNLEKLLREPTVFDEEE
jgi:hypothetical protein